MSSAAHAAHPSIAQTVALRPRWQAAADSALLPLASGQSRTDISSLMAELLDDCGVAPTPQLEDLCVTLRAGGYQVAEIICEYGGVQKALTLLLDETSTIARRMAAEALWLMIYDHESSRQLIDADGHTSVLQLVRREGSEDGALACSSLRVLGETLYSEGQSAELWKRGDLEVVIEALDWALRSEAPTRNTFVATVCNIAALWIWRARGPAVNAIMPLVVLIPRLLEMMAANPDDADVLKEGCRVMHALAQRCRCWPENIRQPAMVALAEITRQYQFCPRPDIGGYGVHALQAVGKLEPEPLGSGNLSTMD